MNSVRWLLTPGKARSRLFALSGLRMTYVERELRQSVHNGAADI